MKIAYGISWDDSKKATRLMGLFLASVVAVSMLSSPVGAAQTSRTLEGMVSVIVRALPGGQAQAVKSVESAGGTVEHKISIIHGFSAKVPADELSAVQHAAGVAAVSPNGKVQLEAINYDPSKDVGSMYNLARSVKADQFYQRGITGKGVDVAIIDTGIAPVSGINGTGKVVNGADLSFDSQADNLRYLDAYGHGTHLAGIIAGRDASVAPGKEGSAAPDQFLGVAPDARLINVKVGSANGAVDVSQVLAAIDWVVQHRSDNGMNIKVLNLSFGTDSNQPYVADPLDYAAEVAWRKGIVVVAAAGNNGFNNGRLEDPANDPYVIAVGANDTKGTWPTNDDTTPDWTARGDGTRNPDLVAPGTHIVSLRVPGSNVDMTHPEGYVSDRYFRGSGTSQAAAVVSGAVALIEQQRPGITPDQVKALLKTTASKLPLGDPVSQGAGELDLAAAAKAVTPVATQTFPLSTGMGSLELSRGTMHVQDSTGSVLQGEMDIMGNSWSGNSWSGNSWSGVSWSGGQWNGVSWSGNSWSGNSWSGVSWSGVSWSGNSWSGVSWSSNSWSSNSWSGNSWSGNSWSGVSWSGVSWSGNSWSGNSWSGNSWSGNSWSGASWD
ncbi:MAG: S8 family serine peptidase [Actinomycetota bacterium]|nr:S8 family serine peptidase [Actinomycetota bacterium]